MEMVVNELQGRFWLNEEQTEALRELGVNVELGSCIYNETDMQDGISLVEHRTFMLHDMLYILEKSGVNVKLYQPLGTFGYVAQSIRYPEVQEEAQTPLDAVYKLLYRWAKESSLPAQFLV